jgi:hypothetical protein
MSELHPLEIDVNLDYLSKINWFYGPFRIFVAEHLATPFPFIARSTAHKQYHKPKPCVLLCKPGQPLTMYYLSVAIG